MEIRRATKADIDKMVENRMEFVQQIRTVKDATVLRGKIKEYLEANLGNEENHHDNSKFISYLALDQGKIVSSCMLSIYEILPTASCVNGKTGLLLNVYTVDGYRRQGLAHQLLTKLIQDAKAQGVSKILLDYTDDGHPLYQKLGFKELDRQMELKLNNN